MIKRNNNAPTLRAYLAKRRGTFNSWRHEHTNYDGFCQRVRRTHGYNSAVYKKSIAAFVVAHSETLTANDKNQVLAWGILKIQESI